MANSSFRYHNEWRWEIIFMLLSLASLLLACAGPTPPATTQAVVATSPPTLPPTPTAPPLPSESEVGRPTPTAPPGPTAEAMPVLTATDGLTVPGGWFFTPIEAAEMDGVVFVQQDPALLAAFDDPALAVPADFAGGALILMDLPAEAEPSSLVAGMEAGLATLSDQEFEAMLVAADSAGLINMSAVDHAVLQRAWADSLGGRPAMVMAGTIHFVDEQPPVLQGEIWLSWTEDSFVTFYALATEASWSQVAADFAGARQSVP